MNLPPRLAALWRGAANAVELLSREGLGTTYRAPYEVVHRHGILELRHYATPGAEGGALGDPLLLVPPLMVTAEVYDISAELSGVAALAERGVDVWCADFGAPEDAEGGWDRTLDDHVLAVHEAIDEVVRRTGRPVHLLGYSQGGMFCYQAAAWRRGADVASIIALGSPVDLRRNLPLPVDDTLVERFLSVTGGAVDAVLGDLRGLPGTLTSAGFKLFSPRQELRHLLRTLGRLHDRDALARDEPKRRFLGGEGFIAWPGPAFRAFVNQFVVENRLRSGGFVVAGRIATLADLELPILVFVGDRDDMARSGSVRAIRRAAPAAEHHEVHVDAGHFGLVVGSRAMATTWPTVAEWIAWQADAGPRPAALDLAVSAVAPDIEAEPDAGGWLRQLAVQGLREGWRRLGQASLEATELLDVLRWQLPRLVRLLSLDDGSRVSLGRLLAEQAHAIPHETFFLWGGRAYTYQAADERVSHVAHALSDVAAVARHSRVAVLMDNHPDALTVVAACSRLGAIPMLVDPSLAGAALEEALLAADADALVLDPRHGAVPRPDGLPGFVLRGQGAADGGVTSLDAAVAAAPDAPPEGADPGLGADLGLILITIGPDGRPAAARVSNRRQVSAALWGAIACELTPRRTVYQCLPLHDATGMLAAVGAALVGGARLALAPRFDPRVFWADVRRAGADVVFYSAEVCEGLVSAPRRPEERAHPVRLFVGTGLRPPVWRRLLDRFGALRVIEFYGSTEANVILAHALSADGESVKPGSVGRPFAGADEVVLARWDDARGEIVRGGEGRAIACEVDEPGVLLSRVHDPDRPIAAAGRDDAILRDVFEVGDAWRDSGDLLRRDADGDFWLVARGARSAPRP